MQVTDALCGFSCASVTLPGALCVCVCVRARLVVWFSGWKLDSGSNSRYLLGNQRDRDG